MEPDSILTHRVATRIVGDPLEELLVADRLHNARALHVVAVIVCLAAGLVSVPLGMLATVLYDLGSIDEVNANDALTVSGAVLGLAGGLLAGLLWANRMNAAARKQAARPSGPSRILFLAGTFWGVVCGIVATLILHGGLMVASAQFRWDAAVAGLIFAIPTGAVLGLVFGVVWWFMTRKPPEAALPPASQQDGP